jgi:hypothetical protein
MAVWYIDKEISYEFNDIHFFINHYFRGFLVRMGDNSKNKGSEKKRKMNVNKNKIKVDLRYKWHNQNQLIMSLWIFAA